MTSHSLNRRPDSLMPTLPTLYGFRGFTHGGAKVLTVMSPDGAAAAAAAIAPDAEVIVYGDPGLLTQYHEKCEGALQRLVDRHGIIVLEKPDWDARKYRLGDAIYR